MMTLGDLDLAENDVREAVSILVGPNGSGKSSALREIAMHYKKHRNVAIICNTRHDRFVGLRSIKRISASRSDQSPKNVVKKAVANSLSETGSAFFQISSILEYCGYEARFGFEVVLGERRFYSADDLRYEIRSQYETAKIPRRFNSMMEDNSLDTAMSFLQRLSPGNRFWLDAREGGFKFSRLSEFGAVLKLEALLRRLDAIRDIKVFLRRSREEEIEMELASSGQLFLISSLLYLITNTGDDPIIIIDEPENSLHPSWQREYIEKILAAMSFRNASIFVATHAPLVVTGALASNPDLVSVFEVRDGVPKFLALEVDRRSPSSIEEILWRAFEVVTPANHFVSEQIVDQVSLFEKGEVSKDNVLLLIQSMEAESFDERQRDFFDAVKKLLDKIESAENRLT
ncbi:AAA family ATPase [Roseibium sp. MB-4]